MSNIADDVGVYEDFTGTLSIGNTECEVKNATFEIFKDIKRFKKNIAIQIEFNKGIITSGTLYQADIKHCNFRGSYISYSIFRDGIFSGRSIDNSYWLGGEFDGRGCINLYDKFSRLRNTPPTKWNVYNKNTGIADTEGVYTGFNGTIKWKNSEFVVEDAEFEITDGALFGEVNFMDGVIVSGTVEKINVEYCLFKGGTWVTGWWKNGKFLGGTWKDGWWYGGTWVDGTWIDGRWRRGYDKYGELHHEWDSPNKWNR